MKTFSAAPMAALVSWSLVGCGMITGLSDDYAFVPEAGADAGPDGSNDAAAACVVAIESFGQPCRACVPTSCCALAACLADDACKRYALCRNQCLAGNQQCLKGCDNRATSAARSDLANATNQCGVASSCTAACGW